MLCAVAFLHNQDIVSLDLRAQNFVVIAPTDMPKGKWSVGTAIQRVVLVDFREAAKVGGTYRGGPISHVAPESLADDGHIYGVATPEVDLYSLAATFRSFITGEVKLHFMFYYSLRAQQSSNTYIS